VFGAYLGISYCNVGDRLVGAWRWLAHGNHGAGLRRHFGLDCGAEPAGGVMSRVTAAVWQSNSC
jgi:hypothetical protein